MKILVIHNSYLERGGEDEVVDSEIRMLEKFGHTVIFHNPSNKEIEGFSFSKKVSLLRREISWSEDSYIKIKELAKKEKPDIAHIHNIFFLISPSVYYTLNEKNIPIVQTLHNYRMICPKGILFRDGNLCEDCIGKGPMQSIMHRCFKNSFILNYALAKTLNMHFKMRTFQDKINAYITLGEFSLNKFIKAGLPMEKMFIKPNFMDTNSDKRRDFQDFILYIGRLVDYKGIRTLIKAIHKLRKYALKIIGAGPLYNELKRTIKKMNNITLLGRLSHDKVIEYLRASSFLILPSECYEITPRVVIESLSCGVPILVSNRGFMEEAVDAKGIGLSFEARNINDLSDKIHYLMENKGLIAHMGENAFQLYKQKYTLEKNYDILIDIYNKVLSRPVS